jgi:hypothetical protein
MVERTDTERLDNIREYARGLAQFGSDIAAQFATDVLFMAGEHEEKTA